MQIISNPSVLTPNWGNAETGNIVGATTVSLGQNGLWSFFQSSPTASEGTLYNSTGLHNYTSITLSGAGGGISGASFADFQRTGYAAILSQTTSSASNQTLWTTTDGLNYNSQQMIGSGTSVWHGGVVGYDKTGDGYLDFAFGDSYGDSTTFITNTNGVLSLLGTGVQGKPPGMSGNNFSELSSVDLTNDGAVDVVMHTTAAGNYALSLLTNNQASTTAFTQTNISGVFKQQHLMELLMIPLLLLQ
ncbi:MAG: hypothetical protein GAK29_04276 [Acinetobacter bereziniae]|uniref:Uncharacterized protein n=1 Tax=Acinetobacter bereziniae TaxID=106648 RepID=A0A833UN91_ACIBZ|nr:MAG: hypothetical protein GAK29_04276 [Acinetobacter bereziniae]